MNTIMIGSMIDVSPATALSTSSATEGVADAMQHVRGIAWKLPLLDLDH